MSHASIHTAHPRLWIDLDNSPHVPLYAPLIRYWRGQGWPLIVTARDFAQTLDLVEQLGVDAIPVGKHAGRNTLKKVANLPIRTTQLLRTVRDFRPQVALSHGSRTQVLAARLLGIPSIVMFDYEWTEMSIFKRFASLLLCPEAITEQRLSEAGIPTNKVGWYPGYKEDLYLHEFTPDPGFRALLGVGESQRLITIRPPGIIGNYHEPRSEELCTALLQKASADPDNFLVVLPKTGLERQLVESALPPQPAATVLIPERALPGLQLLYNSDIVVSGGGTMNREAALLGVPTYSMFTGKKGAVDERLAAARMLSFLEKLTDIVQIEWKKRDLAQAYDNNRHNLVYDVIVAIHKFG